MPRNVRTWNLSVRREGGKKKKTEEGRKTGKNSQKKNKQTKYKIKGATRLSQVQQLYQYYWCFEIARQENSMTNYGHSLSMNPRTHTDTWHVNAPSANRSITGCSTPPRVIL